MFDILLKYHNNNHFDFSINDRLSAVCNASKCISGVYLVWDATDKDNKELLYIGRSGEMKNGILKHRQDGLYGRLVKGKQFGKSRRQSWPEKMKQSGIETLSVYWFDTEIDDPEEIEDRLLSETIKEMGAIPKWNKDGPKTFYP